MYKTVVAKCVCIFTQKYHAVENGELYYSNIRTRISQFSVKQISFVLYVRWFNKNKNVSLLLLLLIIMIIIIIIIIIMITIPQLFVVVGNRKSDPSSNPEVGCLGFFLY